MKILKDESGQALFLVMMVITVLVLTGAASLTRTGGSRLRSFEEKKMVQASYIAEAGVEKALAQIKNDYTWLKGLDYNTENNFITSLLYIDDGNEDLDNDGYITSVKVKRTSTGDNPTTFYIESRGDYQGATRTLKVTGEMYDPVDFGRGVWVRESSTFSNNTIFHSDITAEGNLTFENNSYASGTIRAVGDINLENNMANQNIIESVGLVTGGNLNVANNVKINTNVEVAKNMVMSQNALVRGNANVMGNIKLANNAVISGDVYYNGDLLPNPLPNGASTGTIHPGEATTVTVNVPAFPVLEESLYEQYPNIAPTGTLSGTFNVDGIHYVPGNLSIEGTYHGNGMIVTHGTVTITGDLMRAEGDKLSSLAIVAFGKNLNGIGIISENKNSVAALLYSPYKISLNNKYQFYGSLVCEQVIVDNNAVVTYDNTLHNNQPRWMTTVIKITSWKEANPVF